MSLLPTSPFDRDYLVNENEMGSQRNFARPDHIATLTTGKVDRTLTIYPAQAGYDLQDELDYLSYRAIEPNVFFTSRFLAPAMPRLEERDIKLAIMRDETAVRSRLRLLIPYSIERPGFAMGSPIIRVWSNPFAPLATPLLDADGAAETIEDFLEALGQSGSGLPSVIVFPDVRLTGPFTQLLKAVAINRNLPVSVASPYERPMLESLQDGETYLKASIKASHLREMRRQWNRLEALGTVNYTVARQPYEIRLRMEEFLLLEASGWKGRKRSAMLSDRYQSAFAREAVSNLAEIDGVRIHTIDIDGQAIASMVVLLMNGEAYTWKTAFNEGYAQYSPGKLLVAQLTDWHLDDANIIRTDSCAIEDHPVMARFWTEREKMGTVVIGLKANSDRDVRQVTAQLHLYQNTRSVAKMIRRKIMSIRRR